MNPFFWEFIKTAVTVMVIFCVLMICLSIVIMTIQAIFHSLFFSKTTCPPQQAPAPTTKPK
jgi:hypothetical protein